MLTAYDYTTAGIVDEAGVDCILVGRQRIERHGGQCDHPAHYARPMIYHASSVVRAVKRAW